MYKSMKERLVKSVPPCFDICDWIGASPTEGISQNFMNLDAVGYDHAKRAMKAWYAGDFTECAKIAFEYSKKYKGKRSVMFSGRGIGSTGEVEFATYAFRVLGWKWSVHKRINDLNDWPVPAYEITYFHPSIRLNEIREDYTLPKFETVPLEDFISFSESSYDHDAKYIVCASDDPNEQPSDYILGMIKK